MSFKVTSDFSKLLKLTAKLKELDGTVLEWGFFEDKRYGAENDNLPVAAVALWNEQGDNGPARPFFSSSVDSNKKEYRGMCKQIVILALSGARWQSALKALGAKAVRDVQESISTWNSPMNSPSWTAFKASVGAPTKPLEYTGVMRDSVDYRIKGKT